MQPSADLSAAIRLPGRCISSRKMSAQGMPVEGPVMVIAAGETLSAMLQCTVVLEYAAATSALQPLLLQYSEEGMGKAPIMFCFASQVPPRNSGGKAQS